MSITIERIQKLTEEKGLSVRDLAEEANCSKSAIQRYISGERGIPTDVIVGLANAFDVHPAYLFGWTDDRNYDPVEKDDTPYYADKETDEYAERIHKNPQLRILFDATQDLNTNDIDTLLRIVEGLKATKGG